MALKPHPILSEYNVTSNDVLSGEMRVNVTCSRTGRVLWYQDRQLGENEILEGIYDDRAMLRWVVHRPTRGWYIRIRSPTFPPNSFISLTPSTADSRQAAAGWLEFGCRTNPYPPVDSRLLVIDKSDGTISSSEHFYPPSASNSPSSSTHTLTALSHNQITKFVLKPFVRDQRTSLLWRTLSTFRQTVSFTLLPAEKAGEDEDSASHQLVSFQERSQSSFATSSGIIIVNETLALQMGVEKSFWIAIALAYWEFLNERESYLASAEG